MRDFSVGELETALLSPGDFWTSLGAAVIISCRV